MGRIKWTRNQKFSQYGQHFRGQSDKFGHGSLFWKSHDQAEVTIRASYLESCFPSCHSVCPAASMSREQAFYWLLRKHRYSIPLLLMISLSLLAVNYFVKPACVGVSHCWRVSPHAILWASGRRIRAEQIFLTRLIQKPPSVSTLLTARPSFGWQDNLPVQYVFSSPNIRYKAVFL
jgi:hypothetical protein